MWHLKELYAMMQCWPFVFFTRCLSILLAPSLRPSHTKLYQNPPAGEDRWWISDRRRPAPAAVRHDERGERLVPKLAGWSKLKKASVVVPFS